MKLVPIHAFNEVMNNKKLYKTQEVTGYTGVPSNGEGNQGEYNEKFLFYKHPDFPEGIFLRETWITDSYGYNASIEKIEFVEGKEKLVTVFESIS